MKNQYVCNISNEEVEPLIAPAMNFDKQDKQDGGQGPVEDNAETAPTEGLKLPVMNFGGKE